MLTLSSKNFKRVFQQNGSEWRVANSEWFSGGQNLSANREIGKSASREMAANGDWRLANGEQRVANSKWRMVNEKPSNFYALRITLYA
jgi:hypothetical protein